MDHVPQFRHGMAHGWIRMVQKDPNNPMIQKIMYEGVFRMGKPLDLAKIKNSEEMQEANIPQDLHFSRLRV